MTTLADFAQGTGSLPGDGHDWVRNLRAESTRHFEALGLPGKRWEDWKYTDMKALAGAGLTVDSSAGPISEATAEASLLRVPTSDSVSHVVFLDGVHVPAPSRIRPLPKGVRLTSIRKLLESDPAFLQEHLGSCVSSEEHPFVALNTALMHDGLVLHLEKGCVVDDPINLVFLGGESSSPRGMQIRVLVVAEEGSRAVIFESHGHDAQGPRMTNEVTEVILGAGGRIEHYRLQAESEGASHVSMLAVEQGKDSGFTSGVVTLGGTTSRNEMRVRRNGTGAHCNLEGVWLGSGEQHHDTHTYIDHAVPSTTSAECYKGILDDRSTGAFTGRVVIREGAQGSMASQQNKNLLLSDDSAVNSRPQLEIYANDVKCNHGATTGRLDPASLFYLRSRGIPLERAKGMLTSAFAWEILEHVGHDQVRSYLKQTVADYLGHHVGGEDA